MRSEELSVELQNRIVSRHRSGERYQNISAALKVPKNTVASFIIKWKKIGTTKTLPRVGHFGGEGLGEGSGEKVWEVNKNPKVTLKELQFLCGDGRNFQKDSHLCSTQPIRLLW
uniref:Sleeping Beauty transposase HTH domain-containing protein n=1 Tax=Oncorhynchus tshawytscha TaxID=74940 RepID=A0AAZ3PEF8_ONCTS